MSQQPRELQLGDLYARARIREVQSGSAPTPEAVTKGRAVGIMAGDTLEGGKQNRVVNVAIWLAPRSVTAIPVTCRNRVGGTHPVDSPSWSH